jgi:hypothetical protein
MTNQTNGKHLEASKTEDLDPLTDDHHVIQLMEVIKHGNADDFVKNWSGVNLNRQVALWNVTFPDGAGKAADRAPTDMANDDRRKLDHELVAHLVKFYQKKSGENVAPVSDLLLPW